MNLSAYNVLFTILSFTELHLVKDVLKYKALHFGTLLYCENTPSVVGLERFFNKYQVRISRLKIGVNASSLLENTDHRVGLILKTSCKNWTHFFIHFDSKLFKNAFYSWLIFTDDVSSTTETLSMYPIEVDSDVTVISKSEGTFQLYEVYNTGFYTKGRFRVEHVGYWWSELIVKRHRRTDWSGVVLKSAVVVTQSIEGQTFDEYMSRSRLSVDSLHKLKFFTLLKYWREMFNFSFVLQRTDSWGYPTNGSFDGLVGALQRRGADVGGTPVFLRADRARVVDYVTATWPSRPCFIFRHPKHPAGFLAIYTRPLTDQVWCCLVGMLVVTGALLCVLMRLRVTQMEGDEPDSSASLALLSMWSAVCQQGEMTLVWCCLVGLLGATGALLCVLMRLRVTQMEGDEPDSSASLALLSMWSAVCQQGEMTLVWCCLVGLLGATGTLLCVLMRLRVTQMEGDEPDSSASLALLSMWSAVCQQGEMTLVWCCLVGLLVVTSALLCVLMRLRVTQMEGDEPDSSASLALLSVWSAVCQQGMAVNRHSPSVRLVVFSSFLFALTVYQYYNATVVSTLLRAPPVTIRSLEDLLRSRLRAGVEDVLYNRDYFKRTTDPMARELYSKKLAAPHPQFYGPEAGMALVQRGGFAFHADPAVAYPVIRRTFTEREICELQEINLFPPQNMFAVTKKGSPYKDYLSYSIRKMSEAGLMHRLKSVWDEAKPPCVRTPDSSVFTVSLREFSTPLLLLLGGMVTATWIFVAEVAIYKLRRNRIQFRL